MDLLIGLLVNKGRKNFGGISSPRGAFYVLYWLASTEEKNFDSLAFKYTLNKDEHYIKEVYLVKD